MEKIPLRVEPQHPLDKGTEWVVGRSTETVDSFPSTESVDSWAAAPSTESVDSWAAAPSTESVDSWAAAPSTESIDFSLSKMSLVYVWYLASRMTHGCTAPLPGLVGGTYAPLYAPP